jgi:hypothetical protein
LLAMLLEEHKEVLRLRQLVEGGLETGNGGTPADR